MRLMRHRGLRALHALLLLIGFAISMAEAGVADVHDGDAPHAEVDRVTGIAHSDHAATLETDGSTGEGSEPSHPFHVCHCVHAHIGVVADRQLPSHFDLPSTAPFRESAPRLIERDLDHWTPPPILAVA